MNIVILAGGTGSIALQTGLYEMLDSQIDGVETKILLNGYDNGLSTGAVRKVMGGKILGPSDVRKNQTTRLKLENPQSPWNKFLDIRFSIESSKAKQFCLDSIDELKVKHGVHTYGKLDDAINSFFETTVASKIDYNDFSLANIIYAGLAKSNGNSLRSAAKIMADLMGIKDNVILNDDSSMFLGAITASGIRVTDEGDIVSWGDVDDPFVDLFFTNPAGEECTPKLCDEAREALLNADLIILSSGTQWSSLIPTYESSGFRETMADYKGKVIMVMNRQPDKDSPGQTANDIINILVPRYFGVSQLEVILDETGHKQMASINDSMSISKCKSINTFNLSSPGGEPSKHSPAKLAYAISKVFFAGYGKSSHFMFDYDDTLVGRGNFQPKASAYNRKMLIQLKNTSSVSICTGNSIRAVALRSKSAEWLDDAQDYIPLTVFADGGVNKYEYDTRSVAQSDDNVKSKLVECIDQSAIISKNYATGSKNIILALKNAGIPLSKIENRGDVVISIKPIDDEYRPAILTLVDLLLKGSSLQAKATGRTTIDISYPSVSKASAVKHVLDSGVKQLTFVGDEFTSGNDAPVSDMKDPRVKCLSVKNPAMTAFFFTYLFSFMNRGF